MTARLEHALWLAKEFIETQVKILTKEEKKLFFDNLMLYAEARGGL